jgi:hypothetical protein
MLPTVLYAHEAHGIELIWDQLPTHRGVKQDAHQIHEMGLAMRPAEKSYSA